MKNIQIFDRADNATFSMFQATDEEFEALFPNGQDMELIEDAIARLDPERLEKILAALWSRPIRKQDVNGLHGSLFYHWEDRRQYIPVTKREVDIDPGSINAAQRALFNAKR
jgi:hypothetical protein